MFSCEETAILAPKAFSCGDFDARIWATTAHTELVEGNCKGKDDKQSGVKLTVEAMCTMSSCSSEEELEVGIGFFV